jgi:lipopolysaccharide biosynthesis glycosyltransferase
MHDRIRDGGAAPYVGLCPIVLAADEAYVMPLATLMRSIVDANKVHWPISFYVLTDEISRASARLIERSLPRHAARIDWIPIDLRPYKDFRTLPNISRATFARLLLPEVIAETVPRVLYLDSDVLVLDDLQPLVQTSLEGAVVGAVPDALDASLKRNPGRAANMPLVRDYFNAGVLLIDLDRWRSRRVSSRACEYLVASPQTRLADQDALNVACDGQWKLLDQKWNFQGHRTTDILALDASQMPKIVHFITRRKPWKPSSVSLNARLYDDIRSRTLFRRSKRQILLDWLVASFTRFKLNLSASGSAGRTGA